MSVSIEQVQEMVQAEYEALSGRLRLSRIPLDVYTVSEARGTTTNGTDIRNPTPGYTPTRIVLPQDEGNLAIWTANKPVFPAASWDCRSNHEWPLWRTELWHEVVHQYQHQVLGKWCPQDGGEGHAWGWLEAVGAVASHFGIEVDRLSGVL